MQKSNLDLIKELLTGETSDVVLEELIVQNPRLFKFVKNPSLALQVLSEKMLG